MKRDFSIYVEEVECGSEYEIIGTIDGEIIKTKVEYCFDDVLIDVYDFYRDILDDNNYDSRFDNLDVDVSVKMKNNSSTEISLLLTKKVV